jgi:hypothetical protein
MERSYWLGRKRLSLTVAEKAKSSRAFEAASSLSPGTIH